MLLTRVISNNSLNAIYICSKLMEQIIILQGISMEQFLSRLENIIQSQITEAFQKAQARQPVSYLTCKEVAEMLHISLPTLAVWTKLGWLNCHRIGRRV